MQARTHTSCARACMQQHENIHGSNRPCDSHTTRYKPLQYQGGRVGTQNRSAISGGPAPRRERARPTAVSAPPRTQKIPRASPIHSESNRGWIPGSLSAPASRCMLLSPFTHAHSSPHAGAVAPRAACLLPSPPPVTSAPLSLSSCPYPARNGKREKGRGCVQR